MIVIDLIEGYAFPETLRDLDLRRYIAVTNLEANKPKQLGEVFDDLEDTDQLECLKYFKAVIMALGGKPATLVDNVAEGKLTGTVPEQSLDRLNVADIVYLYGVLIEVSFDFEEDKTFKGFKLNGIDFELKMTEFREDMVLNCTFGEYAEAIQTRKVFLDNKENKNHWEIFPEVMSILCYPKKSADLFLDTNMADAMSASFFLNRHMLILQRNTKTSTKKMNRSQKRKLLEYSKKINQKGSLVGGGTKQ